MITPAEQVTFESLEPVAIASGKCGDRSPLGDGDLPEAAVVFRLDVLMLFESEEPAAHGSHRNAGVFGDG